jgi:hypothetical protein
MIVQMYRNAKTNMILLYSKSYLFDKEKYEGYEFIEEFDGDYWQDCNKKITQKYFSLKSET